jgi:RNA polymerase sigma factor (sigma-70 family)
VLNVCRRALPSLPDAEDAFQATFLILARKAASLRPLESVAGWLHGVAYRTAGHARRAARRRQQHERKAKAMHTASPEWEVMWREVQAVLDEEVQGLPVIYRDAFVLCCLENKSAHEAACALGVKEGTVGSRLSKARALLQSALGRRGLGLSAVLAAAALTSGTAVARASATLVASTIRAAVTCAAGMETAGIVSPRVAELTARVTQTMFKMKLTKAILLAASLSLGIAGAGLLAREKATSEPSEPPLIVAADPPALPDKPASDKPASTDVDAKVVVSGRVFNAEGKPAVAARVSVCSAARLGWLDTAADDVAMTPLHAVTDAEGRFAIQVPKGERDMGVKVVATAAGAGLDWVDVSGANPDKLVTLRLRADDVAIEGRLLDLQKQPVVNASVEVQSLLRPADGDDLTAWITARDGQAQAQGNSLPKMKFLWLKGVAGIGVSATTDKAGRFRLTGFGRETVVGLTVRGERVEHKTIEVCTRDDEAALIPKMETYPARFELLLGPSKVATGTVTEKGTGKPIAGAAVVVDGGFGHTDDKGHYRLTGVGKRDRHYAAVRGPHHFIAVRNDVPDSPGAEPITVDFELQPAGVIHGRLTDKDGRPVRGFVWYSARPDNPYLKNLNVQPPALGVGGGRPTTADGAFHVLACPGPGYLAVKAEEDRFTCAEFKESKGQGMDAANTSGRNLPPGARMSVPGVMDEFNNPGDLIPAMPANLAPSYCHAIVAIDPSPGDAKSWTRDIMLDPGKTVKGRLFGPDGKPLTGALAFGLTAIITTEWWTYDRPERVTRLKGADFTAFGVKAGDRRALVFVHPDRNLGKLIFVRGDEREPLEVRLEPLGTATGRLVDSKGKSLGGVVIFPAIDLRRLSPSERKDLPGDLKYFAGSSSVPAPQRAYPAPVRTDARGQFTVAGLLPGIKYVLNSFPEAPDGGSQLATVSVEAGAKTQLIGEVVLTGAASKPAPIGLSEVAPIDLEEAERANKKYAEDFHPTLKGNSAQIAGLNIYGPDAAECVKFTAGGLRITLPRAYPRHRPGTGVVTDFGVRGDFEITASYEFLKQPEGQAGLSLVAVPNDPVVPEVWHQANQNRAMLTRQLLAPNHGGNFLASMVRWKEETPRDPWNNEILWNKEAWTNRAAIARANAGRLRLVRRGSALFFYASENSTADFTLVQRDEFGTKDLKNLRILGATVGADASCDARITDLQIRADAFPKIGRPTVSAAEWEWLTMPMALAAVAMAVGLTLAAWLYLRSRRRTASGMQARA